MALTLSQDGERLAKAIAEAKRELAAERERIKAEEEDQQKTLAGLKARVEALTAAAVESAAVDLRDRKAQDSLETERDSLRDASDRSAKQAEELAYLVGDARDKLADLLATLPPSRDRDKHLERIGALKGDGATDVKLRALLESGQALMDESASTDAFEAQVRTDAGTTEPAKIVRVGWIGYAYRTTSSGRVAVATGAPGGEQGFRWNEKLPKEVRERLQASFASGTPRFLPIDVTQQMALDTREADQDPIKLFELGGPVMWPLLATAILSLLLILERTIYLGVRISGGSSAAEAVLENCRKGDFAEAERLAARMRGPVGRAMSACLTHRQAEGTALEDAPQEVLLHELPKLERFLPVIATLGSVAPMLGLLGTVTGMISTFNMIVAYGTGDPGIMAGGISEALITTVAGLVIAIPVVLVHSALSGRVERALEDSERYVATLVNILKEKRGKTP